jgi:tetratricopeptide (TPR) repeat protein
MVQTGAIGRGTELGRYLVLDQLGKGGMGVVLSAYDPELDRRVALKLVRPELCAGDAANTARERLQREAQAMASFSHPNVVTVFDVGTVREHLFVAMEYVARDLDGWLTEQQRAWADIIAMFIQSAHGLAAAHAAGLVHRDFKPANVLVGDDERPRVSDFGLVAALNQSAAQAGLGTPAYMAPEQFEGGQIIGAAADQFAFCAALYDALYRAQPFAGRSVAEVKASVMAGQLQRPDEGEVPSWLWPVIEKGLSRQPDARHASMAELLSALEHNPEAAYRRMIVVDSMITFGAARAEAGDYDAAESALRDALATATGAGEMRRAAAAQINLAFVEGLGRGQFSVAAERLAWSRSALDGVGGDALLDARFHHTRGCIAHREHQLDDACADLERALQLYRDAMGDDAIKLAEVRSNLGEAMRAAGRPEEACAELEKAHQHALRVRGTMSREGASILDTWAGILQDLGRYDEALERYQQALDMRTTLLGAEHPLCADSHIHLGQLLLTMARFDAAAEHLEQGMRIARSALGPNSPSVRAALNNLGGVLLKKGDGPGAWKYLERALAIAEHVFGAEHAEVASTLNNLGNVLLESAELERAMAYFERALAIRERVFDADHPLIAETLNNIAGAMLKQGRADTALPILRRVREATERIRGSDHASLAFVDINIAAALLMCEPAPLEEAERHLQNAHDVIVAAFGSEHDSLALVHGNRGDIALKRERLDEAAAHYQRSIANTDRAGGGEHAVVYPIKNMAHCLIKIGRPGEVVAPLERAIAFTEPLGRNALLATLWGQLAAALWDSGGDRERAESLARDARALFVELGPQGAAYVPFVDSWLSEHGLATP